VGGFCLFIASHIGTSQLEAGAGRIEEVPFFFDPQGTKVIYVGEDHW